MHAQVDERGRSTVLRPTPAHLGRVGGDSAGQLERMVDRASRSLESAHRAEEARVTDRASLRRHQDEIRRRARDMVMQGNDELGPVRATAVSRLVVGSFGVETVHVADDRDIIQPVTVVCPVEPAREELPAVVLVPGHGARLSVRNLNLAAGIASAGCVVAVCDVWGQGERSEFRNGNGDSTLDLEPDDILPVREHNSAGAALWAAGDSFARQTVLDVLAVIEYMKSRADVDDRRVGITGPSGGGLLTTWAMMLDQTLAAAAPLIFVSEQAAIRDSGIPQCAEQILLGDGTSWLDHTDALIHMAPRPVFVGSGDYDFFPIEGAVRSVDRARRIYQLLGSSERLRHERFPSGHDVTPEMTRRVAEFFADELGAERLPEIEQIDWPLAELASSREGKTLAAATCELLVTADDVTTDQARTWLSNRIAPWPRGGIGHVRWTSTESARIGGVGATRRTGFWPSGDSMSSAGVLLEPDGGYESIVLALFDRGTLDLAAHPTWVEAQLASRVAVFAVDVRATGTLLPRERNWFPLDGNYGTVYELATNLLRLGTSLEAGRASDVLVALALAREIREDVRIESWCFANAYALHSAVVDGTTSLTTNGEIHTVEEIVRLFGATEPRVWQLIIPGSAIHAPTHILREELGSRWTHISVGREAP